MKNHIPTNYKHKDGPVVISQGIGDSLWGVFIKKTNGSLKRFKPIKMELTAQAATLSLYNYKGKALTKSVKSV